MGIKPQFFLVRPGAEQITPNGQVLSQPATAVPLIPADLLPEWIEVIGAPRSLSPDETRDMGNLGVFHAELDTYKLRFAPITRDGASNSDESDTSEERATECRPGPCPVGVSSSRNYYEKPKPTTTTTTTTTQLNTHESKLKPAQGLSSSRHNPANQQQPAHLRPISLKETPQIPTNTAAPSSQLPSPCRHWCHHGVCKWGRDCHYEHVMPITAESLGEVGLTGFPDWWLQAQGLVPMSPKALRAADASHGRRTARKIENILRRKQRARVLAQRRDVHSTDLEEESEAEDEDEDEDGEDVEEEVVKLEPKRGGEEGILINLD
ncbi:transcription factor [Fusarium subglutinans]|uniref:Transcription factor n=1 Tax=Gibberella subglutinans TaxID=42677 RepID=A0A8H5UW37_GIBSU|nr:transcription factor [Fusarium subglutinans]KAF5601472.1 transcription factor [Fusarium subglutinans]